MAIEVMRTRIIHGAATRLELDTNDLGPTIGSVVVRREADLIEIQTDLGGTIQKSRVKDQMFVETDLAESTLQNLVVAWGGTVEEILNADSSVAALRLKLDLATTRRTPHELIIEGPGTDNYFRRYTFPNVVSLVQTEQSIQKRAIISVPIEFEVMMDPQLDEEQFGKIEELTTP